MKTIHLIFFLILSTAGIHAQQITDGLRYSLDQNIGTARFTALSGAMGALGGDFSAMRENPAGSAVFMKSNITLTTSLLDIKNTSSYYNQLEKTFSDDIIINQMGGVFVFDNFEEDSSLKKFTVGFNYDMVRGLDDEIYIAGRGRNSLGNFFLEQAQGIPLNLLQLQAGESIADLYSYLGSEMGSTAQNAFLGYQAYLFDPLDPDNPLNSSYVSNVSGNSFNQEYLYRSRGYNSKFTINLATQITNDFYFGVNLNTHAIDFSRNTYFVETNNNPGSIITGIGFENNLSVTGTGISAQFGAIAKVAYNFRFGLNWDTPTWFRVSEITSQYLESQRLVDQRNVTAIVDPRVINIYADYDLKTPGKLGVSTAYIFGQKGLLSFDYSYKDYSNIEFQPKNNSYFRDLNYSIKNTLKGVSTFKAGAEYRINQLSLRGGFHYEESPYRDDKTLGDLTGFSLGTGYSFGNWNLDLAYSRSEQDRELQMYSQGFTDKANINSVYSNFILSLAFDF
ncbi:transporter [Aequorivita sp. H23M31]|uniref:Transporter n=1 Tax=Aequorivita ciconiae TaxID=2494375 RepID=A0A410G335_9FLAO|nr:outer membrane protein transport protein [Aequorivita sp. H23M31]QAA81659.1 transporter [Aequorivita sp. H23M31]